MVPTWNLQASAPAAAGTMTAAQRPRPPLGVSASAVVVSRLLGKWARNGAARAGARRHDAGSARLLRTSSSRRRETSVRFGRAVFGTIVAQNEARKEGSRHKP